MSFMDSEAFVHIEAFALNPTPWVPHVLDLKSFTLGPECLNSMQSKHAPKHHDVMPALRTCTSSGFVCSV